MRLTRLSLLLAASLAAREPGLAGQGEQMAAIRSALGLSRLQLNGLRELECERTELRAPFVQMLPILEISYRDLADSPGPDTGMLATMRADLARMKQDLSVTDATYRNRAQRILTRKQQARLALLWAADPASDVVNQAPIDALLHNVVRECPAGGRAVPRPRSVIPSEPSW